MAVDKKISQLTSLAQVDVAASTDVLPIVDTSATETKKITVSALVGAGATAGLTNVDINSGTIDGTTIGASSASTGAFTTLSATGVTTLQAGSASAPAATTTGDTNTGIYFPAADQVAVTTGGTVAAAFNSNGLFFRNRIINGDMRIDQRNAGASVAVADNTNTFITDRWSVFENQTGAFSWQQVTDAPTGFVNSLKCTVTTAQTADSFAQCKTVIEGTNIADLAWGSASALPITLSFWVKSSLTGQMGGALSNSAQNRSYPFSYTVNAANTWEYKTVTVLGDTTGTWLTTTGVGIYVFFDMGMGTTYLGTAGSWAAADYRGATGDVKIMRTLNATWYITGVQLETGSVATPFERRPYGEMLMLCQRYCQKLAGDTAYTVVTDGWQASTTVGYFTYCFSNPMRAAPTLTTGTVGDFYARNGSITSNLSTLTLDTGVSATKESVSFAATWAAAGGASGYGAQLVSGANAPKVILSAEL